MTFSFLLNCYYIERKHSGLLPVSCNLVLPYSYGSLLWTIQPPGLILSTRTQDSASDNVNNTHNVQIKIERLNNGPRKAARRAKRANGPRAAAETRICCDKDVSAERWPTFPTSVSGAGVQESQLLSLRPSATPSLTPSCYF